MAKLKIVIRRIPDYVTQEETLAMLAPFQSRISSLRFEIADPEDRLFKTKFSLPVYNRCYITFRRHSDLTAFHQSFGEIIHRDKSGHISAVKVQVEYAPNQKDFSPNGKRLLDKRINTYKEDPIYQEFLTSYENDKEAIIKSLEPDIAKQGNTEKIPAIINECLNKMEMSRQSLNRPKRNKKKTRNKRQQKRRNRKTF